MELSTDLHEYRVFHERLAQFKNWDNQAGDWEKYWTHHTPEAIIKAYANGNLGELDVLTRYLSKDAPILEAGCGAGGIVIALQERGYPVEGIDFAENTIQQMKAILTGLNIHTGDIYAIDAPDGYYGGYISIGVFEHNPEGPLAGLKEARRVLARDGVALISVPYLNPTRKKWLDELKYSSKTGKDDPIQFYQYYYSTDEFEAFLEEANFKREAVFPYAVYAGLTRDQRLGIWLKKKKFFSNRLGKRVIEWCERAPMWARRRWGHMALYVCRPAE